MLNYNSRTVNLKLERREVCDLLIALTSCNEESSASKWGKLHDKVKKILDAFDAENCRKLI